jgi:hypothetical protein
MSLRDFFITGLCAVLCTPVVLLSLESATAQVMQSTNYKMESDSINFSGGLSTSTNYTLESTAGEVATGDLGGTTYNLRAGYQQMTTSYIAISSPDSVVMSPSIPGVSGGVANGSTTVTVTTDSFAGYSLSIRAETSPALTKVGDSIADYLPVGNPDYTFSTDSTDAHFGYSPSGVNTVARFLDNGIACNTSTGETALACWDGLSTSEETIAQSTSGNAPSGATTTVYFRVGIGSAVVQSEGVYTATTTLTALSL